MNVVNFLGEGTGEISIPSNPATKLVPDCHPFEFQGPVKIPLLGTVRFRYATVQF
jgi:hypothetical protein